MREDVRTEAEKQVDRVEIDGCLFCGFGIARGGDLGSLPRNPSLLSLSSR
jgi:hypothetical protein